MPTTQPRANAITLKSTGGYRLAIQSQIEVFIPGIKDKSVVITAVWDTGASQTCISQKVVDELGLQPIGMGRIHTAAGEAEINKYMVEVGIPPNMKISGVEVSCVTLTSPGLDALIGMDIICLGDFSITNKDGRTCMSFRIPSLHEIDYVTNPRLVVKSPAASPVKTFVAGRNDRCPCGSGKKFKHCHGK